MVGDENDMILLPAASVWQVWALGPARSTPKDGSLQPQSLDVLEDQFTTRVY